MRRRIFVTGSLLALAAAWGARARAGRRATGAPSGADRLPDGRILVRDAAVAFGTTVSIAAVGDDPGAAAEATAEALDRIRGVDSLMTVYRRDSQVGRLNAEGVLSRPDRHLVRVLEFSKRLSALSDGAFDVTVQPLWRLFVACRAAGRRPSPDEVAAARSLVDWTALEVTPRRVALGRRGMQITLNGVAQGYAADLAMDALRQRGIRDALLDAGELGAEGERQPHRPWTVGIQHPRVHDAVIATVAMDGRFLATSGDYATAFSEDLADHHIFDPRTGRSPPGLSSAAVAAASGMEADGLTKPMMVLELARARALLARFDGAGAIWMDKRGRVVASERMPPGAG
ncbi:MAG TPA: FAD:protein FMN transferase [Anaeromyxobacteraceae bacterium]|nr:FAD:protein FMN transferase [Anaeromyxobacteraceae bacterium]